MLYFKTFSNIFFEFRVLTPWQERTTELQTFDFDPMSKWDKVRITQDGENGINFDIFRIRSQGKTIDVVGQEGCTSSWFDQPDPEGVQECFQQTVSNDRVLYI